MKRQCNVVSSKLKSGSRSKLNLKSKAECLRTLFLRSRQSTTPACSLVLIFQKKLKLVPLLFLSLFFLTACAIPASKQILPELIYSKPVKTHTHYHLLLSWKSGEAVPSDRAISFAGGGIGLIGLVGNLVAAEIVADHNRRLKSKDNYEFDQYREAIFMRSLRKSLLAHRVFKSVRMVPLIKTVKPSQVGMTLVFKSTEVIGTGASCEITLDVLLRIKSSTRGKTFSRILFVQSGPAHDVKGRAYFLHQQKVVAKKLLHEIMVSIEQWNRTYV